MEGLTINKNQEYKTLRTTVGTTIEEVVTELQLSNAMGVRCKVDFNGVMLYSDTVTLEEAYDKITGMTYDEYEEYIESQMKG